MTVVRFPEIITSLLYVSRSRPDLIRSPGEVDRLVDFARAQNPRYGITGAIIFTEVHFAQVIEGARAAIDDLMRNIAADERHRDVAIVEIVTVPERRFAQWAMAYSGPSFYVDRHVKPLLSKGGEPAERKILATKLINLLQEFSSRSVY